MRRASTAPAIKQSMEINLEQWDMAFDSQAKAFLVGAREATRHMLDGGRIQVELTARNGWSCTTHRNRYWQKI